MAVSNHCVLYISEMGLGPLEPKFIIALLVCVGGVKTTWLRTISLPLIF